jgi:ubiquinone/menaquinone biosynthesis C-methylase UbiE
MPLEQDAPRETFCLSFSQPKRHLWTHPLRVSPPATFSCCATAPALLKSRIVSHQFQDHFSSVANRYADFRPRYPKALFDYLATMTSGGSLAWDCAAGNGQASLDLATHFDRVLATDGSREQIASATAHPRIEYCVAAAEHSGLPDASADIITVAQALHWFDLEKFYAEARRVLKAGGTLAVWAYGINEVEGEAVNRIVQDYYANVVGPYWPPERRFVEDGYRTLPFPFPEITPPAFHMEAQWTLAQLLGYFGTWSATNRYIKTTGRNPLEPLSTTLKNVWGDVDVSRKVMWPLAMRIGRNA